MKPWNLEDKEEFVGLVRAEYKAHFKEE